MDAGRPELPLLHPSSLPFPANYLALYLERMPHSFPNFDENFIFHEVFLYDAKRCSLRLLLITHMAATVHRDSSFPPPLSHPPDLFVASIFIERHDPEGDLIRSYEWPSSLSSS